MRVVLLFTIAFFFLSCNTKDGYFKAIAANDVTLQPPQKGEWLYRARCIMNGSNTMSETDACPNRLCSECQRKLCWNFGYDNKKRLTQLCGFFKANNLQRDLSVLQSDLAAVE